MYLTFEWNCMPYLTPLLTESFVSCLLPYYFGGAQSKGFAMFRNISKLTFLGQDWAR